MEKKDNIMRKFITADRHQISLLPPSIEEWLPENHLARFVVEVVEELDLSKINTAYSKTGAPPYDPKMMLSLLFYGYATGVFSSRKLEKATYDSVAFRFMCGNHHPDHDSIATFRKRFLGELNNLFVQILLLAQQMGFARIGNVNVDGTKMKANASKHHAMSYDRIKKLESQLKEEVNKLLDLAQTADEEEMELDIPEEIQRRKARLEKLKEAKQVLEQRAAQRYEEEKEAYDGKVKERKAKEEQTGKKPRGRFPEPPQQGPLPKDQYNFTDPQSRIMKTADGFDQCFNGQAAVNDEMLIVGALANAHCNDKKELIPTLDKIDKSLGKVNTATADNGYFSETNIEQAQSRDIDPHVATGGEKHNQWLKDYLESGENKKLPDQKGTPTENKPISVREEMRRKLKTDKGKEIYRKRKMTVEPVFGIIKEIMGFRRFSLRGEQNINGEWLLVCSAYNLKRLFNLKLATV